MQRAEIALSFAIFNAGKRRLARMAMMAITTRSSINVNARLALGLIITLFCDGLGDEGECEISHHKAIVLWVLTNSKIVLSDVFFVENRN